METERVRVGMSKLPKIIKQYDIESVHLITGRGLVFVIDTAKYPHDLPKLSDHIIAKGKLYLITGIEASHHNTWVGLVVREIKE